MEHWLTMCDGVLAGLGAGPLGPAPPGLLHCRALFVAAFTPPLLIDVQPAARCARLLLTRRLPLARHNVRTTVRLPDTLALPSPAEALALRHQDPEPNMRDGVVYMGHVVAHGQRSRFVARDLSDDGHRRYFDAMLSIGAHVLDPDEPALLGLTRRAMR